MFAWFPIVTGILIAVAVRRRAFRGAGGDDLVRSLLLAAAFWGAYLALATEVLSIFGGLRFGPLLATWTLPVPFLLWDLHRREPAGSVQPLARLRKDALATWEIWSLAAVAGIVAVTGLVAFCSAPNTWDSMTYHLPRMMHWAQSGSVAHYPTHEPRQLYLGPWVELVATHFHILGGGDRAARLIQWLAMAGGLLAVSTIAGQLGAGRVGRILSVLTAATIPMGLLQAVSTQTDYAVSFHLLTAVCFLAGAGKAASGRLGGPHLWGAALATGLAVLTKGTAYVVLAPFLAAFTWRLIRRRRLAAWRPLAIFAAVVLTLNLGHYSRNTRLFDSPLQPRGLDAYHRYGNDTHGAGVTISNAARFAALHLTVPAPDLVARSYRAVRGLHGILGLDPEDPRTTWPGMRFEPPPALVHEDFSGNFLHAVLVLACFGAACLPRVRRALRGWALHVLLVAGGCLLFAALLKWTPWSTRLHLPLFVLAAPMIGTLLAKQPRHVIAVTATILVAQAVPFVAHNPLHPLTGGDSVFRQPAGEQMFRVRPQLGEFYTQAVERMAGKGCPRLGLDMPPDAWEYPLWVVLHQVSEVPVHLESLSTGNVSQRLLDPRFEPCAVVCLNCAPPSREHHRARFGAPVLVAADDLLGKADHMLFMEGWAQRRPKAGVAAQTSSRRGWARSPRRRRGFLGRNRLSGSASAPWAVMLRAP